MDFKEAINTFSFKKLGNKFIIIINKSYLRNTYN